MRATVPPDPALFDSVQLVFGQPTDAMPMVERRAFALLHGYDVIVWEVDATNFRFQYVSESAERLLGFPIRLWIDDPAFWVEQVVFRPDVRDVVAALALCTGKGEDQHFSFQAVTAGGQLIPFHAFVQAIIGRRGVATHVRGLMVAHPEPTASADSMEDVHEEPPTPIVAGAAPLAPISSGDTGWHDAFVIPSGT